MNERILCAAIYVDDGKAEPRRGSYAYPKTGLVFCGWRHADCFTTAWAWGALLTPEERFACNERDLMRVTGASELALVNDQKEAMRRDIRGFDQGFLTSTGRYVDRTEGYRIANAAGQVRQTPSSEGRLSKEAPTLNSEDLY